MFGFETLMSRFTWRTHFVMLLLAVFIIKRETVHWSYMGNAANISRQQYKIVSRNGSIGLRMNRDFIPAKLGLLRSAIERDPFETWFFKNRFKSKVDLLMASKPWNSGVFQRKGTTSRLKNVILRSLQGENIGIAIMGGSISAGAGLTYDGEDLRGLYYRVFSDWWRKIVLPLTGSSIKLSNLAMGGTSSNFYAFCYSVFLNPETDMDLAFLDFTVNDYVQFKNCKFPMALPLEQLTREVLSEGSSPAVMFVNFVQGDVKRPKCENLENHGQTLLAKHYGITTFSLRKFLCSGFSAKQKNLSKMFATDGNHISIIGHAQMAFMMINHVRQLMLNVLDGLMTTMKGKVTAEKLSLPSIGDRIILPDCPLKFKNLPETLFKSYCQNLCEHPRCFTQITPDCTSNITANQSLQVNAIGTFGFEAIQKVPINSVLLPNATCEAKQRSLENHDQQFNEIQTHRTDAYGGWKSKSKNSMLELEILIPFTSLSKQCIMEGETPARMVAIAVRTRGNGGQAKVWLNEHEERGVLISSYSLFSHTKLHTIASHVMPGRHVISIRTETPGVFILSGVMVGPTHK
ncbi:uncharacterized protein LOC111324831 [Stylophora pistillata]|uniref:uncharacterized protein LOC111324831 n=1 Tax=Stylophora pistillata TaxID=50429 RepID=UPI000C039E5C|nr:uncharacterized protein LOC111324831 [Stylophora pistillata]